MNTKLRAFALIMYTTQFKPKGGEDEWYGYDDSHDVNIFLVDDAVYVNVYRVVNGNTDTRDLIDEFYIEDE